MQRSGQSGQTSRRPAGRVRVNLRGVRDIRPFVAEVWSAELGPGARHWVLPDGCVDLVFRGGEDPELVWVGPMTRAELVCVDGPTRFLGLRFRPGAAPFVVGCDARDILDRDLPVDGGLLDRVVRAHSDAKFVRE